jgi:hypothetical protein
MWMDWFWQGLLTNGIYALVIVGGGFVFGYLRAKHSDKVPAALFGLAGATCFAILIFTFTGRPIFSTTPKETTPDNLEKNIKIWAEHLGMTIGPAIEPDSYFAYTLSNPDGVPMEVFRGKDKSGFLQFKAVIAVSPEHQAIFAKLSEAQISRLVEQLNLEVARSNVDCTFGQLMAQNDKHQTTIAAMFLVRGEPIQNLSEWDFAQTFDQVKRGFSMLRSSIRLAAVNQDDPIKEHK